MTRDATSRLTPEAALERATDDDWLERVRSAYRGRHDVLDALWWAAHPLTTAPSGTQDPATGLAALQRAVFARPDGDDEKRLDQERRLYELQSQLATDARLLAEALGAATHPQTASEATTSGETHPVVGRGQDSRDPRHMQTFATTSPGEVIVESDIGDNTPPPGGRSLILLGAATAAVLAALVFLPNIPSERPEVEGTPPPVAALPPQPGERTQLQIVPLVADGNVEDPLEILERPQAEEDRLAGWLTGVLQDGSSRRLPDMVGHLELYVARSGDASGVCLVVERQDGSAMSNCVPDDLFAVEGIRLLGSDRYQIWPDATVLSESFTLSPDGDFHYEAVVRAPIRDTATSEAEPS